MPGEVRVLRLGDGEDMTLKSWMLKHRGHAKRVGEVIDTLTGEKWMLYYCFECNEFLVGDKLCYAW